MKEVLESEVFDNDKILILKCVHRYYNNKNKILDAIQNSHKNLIRDLKWINHMDICFSHPYYQSSWYQHTIYHSYHFRNRYRYDAVWIRQAACQLDRLTPTNNESANKRNLFNISKKSQYLKPLSLSRVWCLLTSIIWFWQAKSSVHQTTVIWGT